MTRYAIGDIHGCDAQLANLYEIIAEDLARRTAIRAAYRPSATMIRTRFLYSMLACLWPVL